MTTQKWKNPFYALLIPVGLAFVLTISAYVYMAFLDVNAARNVVAEQAGHPLFVWLRENGTTAVLVELAALGVLTVAAIGTDNWWMAPEPRQRKEPPYEEGTTR